MFLAYCWHRCGRVRYFRRVAFRVCRHCGVPVEECPCATWGRMPARDCPCCEGSGWVAIIRSKRQTVCDVIGDARAVRPVFVEMQDAPASSVFPPASTLPLQFAASGGN